MDVLVVGTVALDSIQTPFQKMDRMLGGSAVFTARAARYFTREVCLVAEVGQDFPDAFLDLLREADLDLSGLTRNDDALTFAWEGSYEYDMNQRDTIATHLNVLKTFKPLIPDDLRRARILCLGNLDPGIQCDVIDQMHDPEFVICDTMNYWIDHTPERLRETLGRIDCLVINDSECRQLADEPNLIRAARMIREMGPEILVVKKGEHGALLFTDGNIFSVPAYPLEDIQDPTGAGDAFMGAFAGYLASQARFSLDALKQATVHGCAMGSFVVEQFGPDRLFQLEDGMIRRRLDAFRNLTAIPAGEIRV